MLDYRGVGIESFHCDLCMRPISAIVHGQYPYYISVWCACMCNTHITSVCGVHACTIPILHQCVVYMHVQYPYYTSVWCARMELSIIISSESSMIPDIQ